MAAVCQNREEIIPQKPSAMAKAKPSKSPVPSKQASGVQIGSIELALSSLAVAALAKGNLGAVTKVKMGGIAIKASSAQIQAPKQPRPYRRGQRNSRAPSKQPQAHTLAPMEINRPPQQS